MRTPIKWAEVHGSLFLAGSNLLTKLDPVKRVGLRLEYDEVKRHLYVHYKDEILRVPETSVLGMVEDVPVSITERIERGQREFTEHVKLETEAALRIAVNAQVSTPMSHVHAGPGHGQTGQEPPKITATDEKLERIRKLEGTIHIDPNQLEQPIKRGPGRPKKS